MFWATVEVGVERVVLKHHRDVAIPWPDVGDVAVADPDPAVVDVLETCEHAKCGRLARPRGADEHHQLGVCDMEIEGVDGGRFGTWIDARRTLEPDVSHAVPPLRPDAPGPGRRPRPRRR